MPQASPTRNRCSALLRIALLAAAVSPACYQHVSLLDDDHDAATITDADAGTDADPPDVAPSGNNWLVRIGGGRLRLTAVEVTDDGTIVAAGDVGLVDPALWIVRLDGNGALIDQFRIDGVSFGYGSLEAAPGGILRVAGATAAWGAGLRDVWLAELLGGSLTVQHTIGSPWFETDPTLLTLADGSFLLAACTDSRHDFTDIVLASFAADGTIVRQRIFGTPWVEPCGRRVLLPGPGGMAYLVAGIGSSRSPSSDVWALAFDTAGTVLWRSSLGGPSGASAYGAAVDGDGLVLAGGTWADTERRAVEWMARLDRGGELSWRRAWDTNASAPLAGLLPIPGGGWLTAGPYGLDPLARHESLWLARVDASGALLRSLGLPVGVVTRPLALTAFGGDAVVVGIVADDTTAAGEEFADAFVARVGLDATFTAPCDVGEPDIPGTTTPDVELRRPAFFERVAALELGPAAAATTPTEYRAVRVCPP